LIKKDLRSCLNEGGEREIAAPPPYPSPKGRGVNTEIPLTAWKTFKLIAIKTGSSKIWSDKGSLLHIKGTQRGGEHGGESRQYHGGAEGTKSDRAVVYVLLITLL